MKTDQTTAVAGNKSKKIDWDDIRRRMDIASAAIADRVSPDAEEARRILKARAKMLARSAVSAEDDARCLEVVEFVLAREHYAVELRYVRDVYPLLQLTPLPCTPAFVLGIVNLHGEILSVIDIKRFFDLPAQGLTDLNKVIVLESGGMCFGILADAIAGVRQMPLAGIQESLPTLVGIREQYLKGITVEQITVLDAEKLLADPKMIVQEYVHE